MTYFFSVIMALTAYFCLSFGFILMKRGIGWIGWKQRKTRTYYRLLLLWVAGFIITNLYGLPSALALRHLSAHILSVFAGWGIVVLVYLSHLVLGERVYFSDFVYSLLIMVGIFFLNISPDAGTASTIRYPSLIILILLPPALFLGGFRLPRGTVLRTVLFGTVSGFSAALMVVALKILVLNHHYQVGRYFTSPYAYLYIGAALLSFIALQAAFKSGPMMHTGPAQYSATILYPLPAAWLVFGLRIDPLQVLAILLITASVILILKKR